MRPARSIAFIALLAVVLLALWGDPSSLPVPTGVVVANDFPDVAKSEGGAEGGRHPAILDRHQLVLNGVTNLDESAASQDIVQVAVQGAVYSATRELMPASWVVLRTDSGTMSSVPAPDGTFRLALKMGEGYQAFGISNGALTPTVAFLATTTFRVLDLQFAAPLVPVSLVMNEPLHVDIVFLDGARLTPCASARCTPSDLVGWPFPRPRQVMLAPAGAYTMKLSVENVDQSERVEIVEGSPYSVLVRRPQAALLASSVVVAAGSDGTSLIFPVYYLDDDGVCIFSATTPGPHHIPNYILRRIAEATSPNFRPAKCSFKAGQDNVVCFTPSAPALLSVSLVGWNGVAGVRIVAKFEHADDYLPLSPIGTGDRREFQLSAGLCYVKAMSDTTSSVPILVQLKEGQICQISCSPAAPGK